MKLLTKQQIYNYLKTNAKNAYTSEIILNNIKENIHNMAVKRFIKKNYEEILTEMLTDEQIETTQRNGQDLFLFPTK
ncbi:MAG: hypothetical protein ACFFE5_13280 [Candidatus Thorarchaeota archaeon]